MNNLTTHSYKDLIVWQKAMILVVEIYKITGNYPIDEKYGLTSETRKTARSIAYNIAEGRRRSTRKDYCHFLIISYGSGGELETQIEIAKRLSWSTSLDYEKIDSLLDEIMRILNTMTSSLRS